MGAPRVWQEVLNALKDAPGVTLHKVELAERSGLTPKQVYGAMNTILRNADEARYIDVIHKANAWRYAPNGAVHASNGTKQRAVKSHGDSPVSTGASTSTRTFEEIGTTKTGLLLRADDGTVWRAEAL